MGTPRRAIPYVVFSLLPFFPGCQQIVGIGDTTVGGPDGGAGVTAPMCGDGEVEGSEQCDGNLLQGSTCQTEGYDLGVLSCNPDTCTLDDSQCADLPDMNRPALATGNKHTCALLDGGAVRCWGAGGSGRLGQGDTTTIGDDELPSSVEVVSVGGTAVALTAGAHTCALLEQGGVRCWGPGTNGLLGLGSTENIGDDELPSSVGLVDIGGSGTVALSAGSLHSCALSSTGSVRCWGLGAQGQLGHGNTETIGDDETPRTVGSVQVGGTVIAVTVGSSHTCALLVTGAVRCWGFAGKGRLGYGNGTSIGDDELPSVAGDIDLGGTAVAVSAGNEHTCALLDTGAVRCWGNGDSGVLGYGDTKAIGDTEVPGSAGDVPIGGTAVAVAAGSFHTCALLDTGAVRCWGRNDSGQLGYGHTVNIGDNELPSSAGDVDLGGIAVALDAGEQHTCALLNTGAVRCWGRGQEGQLGHGDTSAIGDDEPPSSAGNVPFQ